MKKTLLGLSATAFLTTSLLSMTLVQQKEFDLVQSIIPSTKIEKVKHSPIDGIYEAYFKDGNLMYIIPQQRLIFMGELYTNTGTSLTQRNIKEYKTENKILDPLEKSIKSLKPNTKENQTYLKELVDNGIKQGTGTNSKYKVVVLKSLTCPNCTDLDKYLSGFDGLNGLEIYTYLAPSKQSEDFYKTKFNIKEPGIKLKKQMKIIAKRLKGFGVPFAIIIDDDYNLVDTILGFNKTKWNKYLGVKR